MKNNEKGIVGFETLLGMMCCALTVLCVFLSLENSDLKGRLLKMDQLVVDCVKTKAIPTDPNYSIFSFDARLHNMLIVRVTLPKTVPEMTTLEHAELRDTIVKKLATE